MGIPSLNSAILYNVSLYFNLSFLSLVLKRQADYERPQGVERSKPCKYNRYPEPRPQKQAFSWVEIKNHRRSSGKKSYEDYSIHQSFSWW